MSLVFPTLNLETLSACNNSFLKRTSVAVNASKGREIRHLAVFLLTNGLIIAFPEPKYVPSIISLPGFAPGMGPRSTGQTTKTPTRSRTTSSAW